MRLMNRPIRLSTLVAICSLGIAIGAVGAAVALLDVLVLNPIRVDAPGRIMYLSGASLNIPGYEADDWWAQARAFSSVGLYSSGESIVAAETTRRRATVSLVSKHFFEVLRHRPAAGRLLGTADARADVTRAAVVSDAFARATFGSPQDALGKLVSIADSPGHVVVGVVASGAELPRMTDIWAIRSESLAAGLTGSGQRAGWSGMSLGGVGRLVEGGTPEAATSQLESLLARLTAEVTPRTNLHFGTSVRARPLAELLSREPATAVLSFLGASLLGLVLAGLNCGLLVMNEQAALRREWAMRQALGATPALVRRTIAWQAFRWALLAALVGIAGMHGLLDLTARLAVSTGYYIPAIAGIERLSWLVAALAVVATAALVAILPVLSSARMAIGPVLNDRRPYANPTAPSWLVRGAVVALQACTGFVIVVGAVVATRDLVRTLGFDTGQQPREYAQVLSLASNAATPEGDAATWDAIWSAATTVPGIETVAMISEVPARASRGGVFMDGRDKPVYVARRFVRGSFDEVLGIRRVSGAPEDQPGSLILSNSARLAIASGASLPDVVRFDGRPEGWRVAAVLQDLRFQGSSAIEEAAAYVNVRSAPALGARVPSMQLLFACAARCEPTAVRNLSDAAALHADVVAPATSLASFHEAAARPTRVRAMVANVYAGIALLIVVAGVYTLSGAVVLGSAFESGMRMTLGAQRAAVVTRLVARVCTPASVGIATGAVLTVAISARLMATPAARPSGGDMSGAALVLFATAVLAALVPAVLLVRRPLVALLRHNG